MRMLMCRPEYYGIEYEINPWMKKERGVINEVALQQWEILYQTILNCGGVVELIPPVKGCPDMIFTANAGFFYKEKIILSHFKYKERQKEIPYFHAWFKQAGFEIVSSSISDPYFEGEGDVLSANDNLFAGYGFRTDKRFYEETFLWAQKELIYCELVNPSFYHLDTCFCPLNNQLALCYLPAFTKQSQENISNHMNVLSVNEEEAGHFACNAIVLDKNVILPAQCPLITQTLEQYGFIVHACEMSEYIKAGGACKCLVMRLF